MRGASRSSLRAGTEVLREQLSTGIHGQELGGQLFGAREVIDGSASLRRALADPSREPAMRTQLSDRLFGGKVSDQARQVIAGLVAQRWSAEHDLTAALEEIAVRAVLSSAEFGQRLDRVEDELFRFERIVAADPGLRDAIGNRRSPAASRAGLVDQLLDGKAAPETLQLARQAAVSPGDRQFGTVVEDYLSIASQMRDELSAVVTTAVPLDDGQRERLAAALARIYSRAVHLNVIVDPEVVGGIKVQVGDEVIDGTVSTKLEDVRRRMTGG